MKSRYKYKWCTLFGYAPDLHWVPIVFQPPAVPLSSAADWQQILSRISDLSFVLDQCCHTQFADRKTLTSVLKFGMGLCNAFLKARGYYTPPSGGADGDVAVTCAASCAQRPSASISCFLRKRPAGSFISAIAASGRTTGTRWKRRKVDPSGIFSYLTPLIEPVWN